MTEDFKLPDTMKIAFHTLQGGKGMAMAKTENGVDILVAKGLIDFINKEPGLADKVDKLGELIVDIEERTGKSFDRPVMLNDNPRYLSFATMLPSAENLKEMGGESFADFVMKDKTKEEKKGRAALLTVPLTALMSDSPLDMKDIEGIILHELGHADSRDIIQLNGKMYDWQESLVKIDKAYRFVDTFPAQAEPLTAAVGGNEAYSALANKLFERIESEFNHLNGLSMAQNGQNKEISPESLLDRIYHDENFMTQLTHFGDLEKGGNLKEFKGLHDATQDILLETIRLKDHVVEVDGGDVKLTAPEGKKRFSVAKDAGESAGLATKKTTVSDIIDQPVSAMEHAKAIQRFTQYQPISSHAHEYIADDFATRHSDSPTRHIDKLPRSGDGDSHPATLKRHHRADTLDNARIGQLVENGSIDEEQATKHTNKVMREKRPEIQQKLMAEQMMAERLHIREQLEAQMRNAPKAKAGESFFKKEESRKSDASKDSGFSR